MDGSRDGDSMPRASHDAPLNTSTTFPVTCSRTGVCTVKATVQSAAATTAARVHRVVLLGLFEAIGERRPGRRSSAEGARRVRLSEYGAAFSYGDISGELTGVTVTLVSIRMSPQLLAREAVFRKPGVECCVVPKTLVTDWGSKSAKPCVPAGAIGFRARLPVAGDGGSKGSILLARGRHPATQPAGEHTVAR